MLLVSFPGVLGALLAETGEKSTCWEEIPGMAVELQAEGDLCTGEKERQGLKKQVSTPNWPGEHLELCSLNGRRCPRKKVRLRLTNA